MTDDLRTRIAAVLLTHRHVGGKCQCQSLRDASTSGEHARHVAGVLIRDLGLHRAEMGEWDVLAHGFRGHRYVTDWEADQ